MILRCNCLEIVLRSSPTWKTIFVAVLAKATELKSSGCCDAKISHSRAQSDRSRAGEKAKETTSPEREQIACQPFVWRERHGIEFQRTDHDGNLR